MNQDEKILRSLALQYREAALTEENQKRKDLHKSVVDLHMVRPIVLIDELPWHELNADGELSLRCQDSYLRTIEAQMRQMLYRHKYIPGDLVLPEAIRVEKIIHSTGIGMGIEEETLSTDTSNRIVSHAFVDQMEEEECLEQLHREEITYDKEESERRYDLVANMIGDIMPVKLIGNQWIFNTLWDDVAQFHGVENTLIDLLLRPEFMHDIADKFTEIYLDKVRQYEELNLFEGAQDTVHCTASYTNNLPDKGFDRNTRYLSSEVWGRGAAQVFGSASPAQREEFEIPYMAKAMEPFGLVYYGCCEPLHNQIDIVEKIPHLRKITVTPWADYHIAAEQIGKKYVAATKANPANVAMPNMDETVVRKELQNIVDACTKNNCSFEIVLKDVSTVSYHPENLQKWERIAMELVQNL